MKDEDKTKEELVKELAEKNQRIMELEKSASEQRQIKEALFSELLLAEERQKRRVATYLHDHISQSMAISKIKLGELRESVSTIGLVEAVDEIRKLIQQMIHNTRSFTLELTPPILYELGFKEAIQWLIEEFQKKNGIMIDFRDDRELKPLDEKMSILLFRAVQELMVNIAKHAQARNIKISILRGFDDIRINVEDDGIGFDTSKIAPQANKNNGFGLFSIRERLNCIGGHFELQSQPGRGTRVLLVAPLNSNHDPLNERSSQSTP